MLQPKLPLDHQQHAFSTLITSFNRRCTPSDRIHASPILPCLPQSACRSVGPPDVTSYGVDPAFKPGTASFQPDLVAPDDGPMLSLYDCGGLAEGAPTYNLVDPTTGLVVNKPPYCAQLFNPRWVASCLLESACMLCCG